MSKIDKSIRNTRYTVRVGHAVNLVIETPIGEQIELQVVDCSETGLQANCPTKHLTENTINTSIIIPSSKLAFPKGECYLGRLAVRRIVEKDDIIEVAFSTIDSKLPVTGSLSHSFTLDLSNPPKREELSSEKFSLAHFIENEFSNVDLFDRLNKFYVFQEKWEKSKKYAYKTVREKSKGPRVNLNRVRKNGRNDYIVMGSNDYLGLAAHPEVLEAAKNAIDKYGFSSTGSPVTTGTSDLHNELCTKLARIHHKESAILFNSGYSANIGIIPTLTTTNDLVVADQLCHASIHDAMQMAKSTPRYFKHNNADHLDTILTKERANYNGCLIITEGVFSMDGDTAKLDEIYRVARSHNARIMVDQAHCFGVVGPNGIGICDKFHLLKEVDVIMGTFSKICGGIGGFAVGNKELIEWLRSFSRAQIFSVSLPPSTVAAVSKALDIFTEEKILIEKLRNNIKHFIHGLNSIGFSLSETHESAVVPVIIGDETKIGEMYQSLLDDGIWCIPIVYPAVGRTNSRFRFTVMANHTMSDLDYAVSCLEKAMLRVGFNPRKGANAA